MLDVLLSQDWQVFSARVLQVRHRNGWELFHKAQRCSPGRVPWNSVRQRKSSDEFTSRIASFLKHLDITMKRLQLKQSNIMHRKTQHRMQSWRVTWSYLKFLEVPKVSRRFLKFLKFLEVLQWSSTIRRVQSFHCASASPSPLSSSASLSNV
jgi:hypothetical protein